MPAYPGLVGGSGRMASKTAGAAQTFNAFIEPYDAGVGTSDKGLYRRPGLRVAPSDGIGWFCGAGPINALMAQDGRAWAVSGPLFGELLMNHSFSPKGVVDVFGIPATISSSGDQGHQLFITAGGNGYIYDTVADTFAQIFDSGFPDYAVQGVFLKSSFIVLGGDGRVHVSAPLDGTSWNLLDSGFVSDFSDRVIGMTRTHDNLFLFGTQNTQPWYNAGVDGIGGYVPVPGTIIESGTSAAFACVELDNAPMWLVANAQGAGMVMRANGYTPQRVSNHAVEYALQRVTTWSNAIATSLQMRGHTWYLVYIPNLDVTWAYDLASGEWTEWCHNDPRYGQNVPFRGTTHCFFNGAHLMGDRLSGAVYEASLDFAKDTLV